MDINKMFSKIGLVPVVVIENEEDAAPLAMALCRGGIPCAEVTFRTDAAPSAIAAMIQTCPDIIVGAGTIINVDQCKKALESGAKFIVSPGFNEDVVRYCIDQDVPVFPGCVTPSEIMKAVNMGLEVVKFFPAESFGGVSTIKALSGPFPGIKFMPTGGINLENLENYLGRPEVIACGGSWMVKSSLISSGKFDEIENMVRESAMLVSCILDK